MVGNAGILTNSSLGAEIDAHSVVIRMNAALTEGFERDVGGKTSLTLFHPDISMPIQHSGRPFLFWSTLATGYEWLDRAYIALGKLPYFEDTHGSPIPHWTGLSENHVLSPQGTAMLHPSFIHYVHQVWNEGQGERPSTGMLATILALHVCGGGVDLYGFDRSTFYSNQYHLSEDRSTLHPWDVEVRVRSCLENASKLRIMGA